MANWYSPIFNPLAASGAWPYIFFSAALKTGYSIFLVAAYRYGELDRSTRSCEELYLCW